MPRKKAPAPAYTVMTLPCADLQVDAAIQPRSALDGTTLGTYSELFRNAEADEYPMRDPLDVFQIDGVYFVADGFHRLHAAKAADRATVPCHVYVGSQRDARLHAFFANAHHGAPYRDADRQRNLEWFLSDAEFAAHGDRQLAKEVGVSHMTVWRTRARLAEEARLQAEIAAMPATATAPKAREQEQLAAYLDVPVDTLKHSLGRTPMRDEDVPVDVLKYTLGRTTMRYESPQAIIKDIARQTVRDGETPRGAAASIARNVQIIAEVTTRPPSQRERPSMSKAAVAARKAEAHRQELSRTLESALDGFLELYPFTAEEVGYEAGDPDYTLPPTAEELVAAVLPGEVEYIAERLTQARTVLTAIESALEARMQATAASA